MTAVAERPAPTRRRDLVTAGVVVLTLAGLNLASHVLPHAGLWLFPPVVAALVLLARRTGSSWTDLGLGRAAMGTGTRWGAVAIGAVALVYAVGVVLPLTREFFRDDRYHQGVAGVLVTALVVIPVGTVVVEELLFRSVLWAALGRVLSQRWVLAVTSALFGLWHVLPSLHLGSSNAGVGAAVGGATALAVAGTVVFTALGGLVFGELRRRTGSVLPSLALHWATNGLGVLFGLLAWQLG